MPDKKDWEAIVKVISWPHNQSLWENQLEWIDRKNWINFFVGMKLKIGNADKKHSVFFLCEQVRFFLSQRDTSVLMALILTTGKALNRFGTRQTDGSTPWISETIKPEPKELNQPRRVITFKVLVNLFHLLIPLLSGTSSLSSCVQQVQAWGYISGSNDVACEGTVSCGTIWARKWWYKTKGWCLTLNVLKGRSNLSWNSCDLQCECIQTHSRVSMSHAISEIGQWQLSSRMARESSLVTDNAVCM